MISKHGMSYKSVKLDALKHMVMAIIDQHDILELGVPYRQLTQTYAIGFNTVIKKAKLAAGLYTITHCLCMAII